MLVLLQIKMPVNQKLSKTENTWSIVRMSGERPPCTQSTCKLENNKTIKEVPIRCLDIDGLERERLQSHL